MKQTTNYAFNKPELVDSPPDITVLNPNFDKIDTQLKNLVDKDTELNAVIEKVKTDYLPKTGGNVTSSLKVKNKTVAVSVNGSVADANGNIVIDVGGDVQSVNGVQPDSNGNVVLDLGGDVQSVDGIEPDDEGNVALNASTRDEIIEGAMRVTDVEVEASVATHEGLQTAVAQVEANLGSKVASVNGNKPDANGNITPSQTGCLPLSGGTMTGAIGFDGIGYIQCKNSTSNGVQIYGGNAFAEGAFLGVYGKDHASRAGWIYANASIGVNSNALIGKPDGTLTWGGMRVAVIDYWRNGSNWYRKWSDGFIEQGGYHNDTNNGSGTNSRTCTLHTPFTRTDYNVSRCITGVGGTDAGTVQPKGFGTLSRSTTSYTYSYPVNWTGWEETWYACGY